MASPHSSDRENLLMRSRAVTTIPACVAKEMSTHIIATPPGLTRHTACKPIGGPVILAERPQPQSKRGLKIDSSNVADSAAARKLYGFIIFFSNSCTRFVAFIKSCDIPTHNHDLRSYLGHFAKNTRTNSQNSFS
jgi:hypothetical protein